jgi:sugar O-acyltransferase (sialic acid O-acetyltransferase NeuD family)
MKPLILVGGGGHCISCIDVIEMTKEFKIVGIIDSSKEKGTKILDYEVIGDDNDIEILSKTCKNFFITIGQIKSHLIRQEIYFKLKKLNLILPIIISPISYVSKHADINEGTIVMHDAIINAGAKVGKCNIINSKSLIEHEVLVGDFCHISTSSIVNGQTVIEDNCFIGSNSVLVNNIKIKKNSIIPAGKRIG